MAVCAEKEVFRLKVAVDNVQGVEVVKSEGHFGGIELRYRVGETLRTLVTAGRECTDLALAEKTEELSACDEVHDHVEVVCVLESAPEVDEEGVSHTNQHLPLRVGVFHLLHLDNLLLIEHLDGIESPIVLGSNEMNTTE